MTTGLLGDS